MEKRLFQDSIRGFISDRIHSGLKPREDKELVKLYEELDALLQSCVSSTSDRTKLNRAILDIQHTLYYKIYELAFADSIRFSAMYQIFKDENERD